ncbi:MAG: hypothetical protein AAF747_06900 [Planctomycetota bacterium]
MLFSVGCGSPPPVGAVRPGSVVASGEAGNAAEVVADWDDIDAAVRASLWRAELAILTIDLLEDADTAEPSQTERHYHLLGVRDELGLLIVKRSDAASESGLVTLTCRVGGGQTPQEKKRAARAVQDFARRLDQLAGVDVAPLDD